MYHVSFSAGTDNTKALPFSTQDSAPNRASQWRSAANALPVVPQDVQLRPAVSRGSGGRFFPPPPETPPTF